MPTFQRSPKRAGRGVHRPRPPPRQRGEDGPKDGRGGECAPLSRPNSLDGCATVIQVHGQPLLEEVRVGASGNPVFAPVRALDVEVRLAGVAIGLFRSDHWRSMILFIVAIGYLCFSVANIPQRAIIAVLSVTIIACIVWEIRVHWQASLTTKREEYVNPD